MQYFQYHGNDLFWASWIWIDILILWCHKKFCVLVLCIINLFIYVTKQRSMKIKLIEMFFIRFISSKHKSMIMSWNFMAHYNPVCLLYFIHRWGNYVMAIVKSMISGWNSWVIMIFPFFINLTELNLQN